MNAQGAGLRSPRDPVLMEYLSDFMGAANLLMCVVFHITEKKENPEEKSKFVKLIFQQNTSA